MRMASQLAPWNLTVASDLRLLPWCEPSSKASARWPAVTSRRRDAIVMATDEAVNNVMRHAHQRTPRSDHPNPMFPPRRPHRGRLLDEVRRSISPPCRTSIPPSCASAAAASSSCALMDELSCQPRGECGNTLRMVKRRRPTTAHSQVPEQRPVRATRAVLLSARCHSRAGHSRLNAPSGFVRRRSAVAAGADFPESCPRLRDDN